MIETNIYIGRQPILDKEGKCVSYELLYRHNHNASGAVFSDNVQATTRVIINLIHNIGLSPIIGTKIGYINVNEHILMSDVLLSLPKSKFIIEILEYTLVSDEIIERVRHLHGLGYRFALDDFLCSDENIEKFKKFFLYVDVVKIDLLVAQEVPIEKISEIFKEYNIRLLAEKVENIEMFERCRDAGFDLFQGYFFEKPTILSGKKIEPSVGNAIDMINTLHSEMDLTIVSQKFSNYPELTFNLLRYVNSAEFNFKGEITSIKQILSLLGASRLRSWLGLFLYGGIEDRLFREAIINAAKFRSKLMSELVTILGRKELADEAFLVGSLSLIDTYLQISMTAIIENIHLSKGIVNALLQREGYLGKLLLITEKLERTDQLQTVIENLAPKIKLSGEQLYTLYCQAHKYEERV
ncbi:MAG: EAL domain-containing protein [Campylobacterales bacterium]|nr:EAL domain-containing protein [Campylobacterales bacterium]